MNVREANVFLTSAALLDPRMKRVVPKEQADMATEWAATLADVALEDALAALRAHYRGATVPVMPAHVLELLGVRDEIPSTVPDIDGELQAIWKAQALAAAGLTAEEFAAHENDRPWLLAHFPPAAPEEITNDNDWMLE